jgi:hypothetical protein
MPKKAAVDDLVTTHQQVHGHRYDYICKYIHTVAAYGFVEIEKNIKLLGEFF